MLREWMGIVGGLCVLLVAGGALAGDGVLEISQSCAVNTGCFPGDDSGFPVTITSAGSYRLTSSLGRVVSGDLSDGFIAIQASNVTLDMAGFTISCTPLGTVLRCSGVASGIFSVPDTTNVVVRNGTIHGLPQIGLIMQGTGMVKQMRALNNGSLGIYVADGLVIESIARENAGIGIRVDSGTVDGCLALDNAQDMSGHLRDSTYRTANLLGDLGGNHDLP